MYSVEPYRKPRIARQNLRRTLYPLLISFLLGGDTVAEHSRLGARPQDSMSSILIPIGITDLLSLPGPEIGYAYFGGPTSSLGRGWSGFDDSSGVYWVPEETQDMTSQVFVHSPWRNGCGIAFAQWPIRTPKGKDVKLTFEIALPPSASRSDGVTYRVKANAKLLFEEHCTTRTFQEKSADLSSLAGEPFLLRLEVDPGPERQSTEDWSLWRDVKLLVGSEEELEKARQEAERNKAKQRAKDIRRGVKLAKASLLPLTSRRNDSVCPSTLCPTKVSIREEDGVFLFLCTSDQKIQYAFSPEEGLLSGIAVSVDGQTLSPSPFQGGPRVHLAGRDFHPDASELHRRVDQAVLQDDKAKPSFVWAVWEYTHVETGERCRLKATLMPAGKSLGIWIEGDRNGFSGFRAQPNGGRVVPCTFAVPGAPMWRKEGVYLSTVADLMQSDASSVHSFGTVYRPLTDGTRNAMRDVFYLTVSHRYEEVLSNITHDPSPYLSELAGRVVLDAWSGDFHVHEQWLKDMAKYGLDSFLMIKHVWQRDGYDRSYPDTMPANARMGGDEALRSLSLTAQRIGHRFNVHENYYDFYPNADSFNEEHLCLSSAGKPVLGWDNGSVVALILKPTRLMQYVRRFSPEIKRRYDCNSAYHDIMPTWHVDFDARAKSAGRIRRTHEITRELCEYDRQLFGGPVVFEADSQNMAGVFDGGCNHGRDMYLHPLAVAYEVLKVHPKMSNHGFGYYERWLPWGYGPGWSHYVMTDRELDRYRTFQIAFGRTGFIGKQLMVHPHGVVREYYLMQAFGRAYTGRRVQHIAYEMEGKMVDAGTAARYGKLSRLRVTYEGGQDVYVNQSEEPWEVAGHLLPQDGALTVGPRAEAWTAIVDGQICDYAHYDDVTFCDARSHVWLPPPEEPSIQPILGESKELGGGRVELAVQWKVGRELAQDYLVFWHFKEDMSIEFQFDHAPSVPTSKWRKGETYMDGPLVIQVDLDSSITSYDFVVGLYNKEGRVSLGGGAKERCIAQIEVERQEESIQAVRVTAVTPRVIPGHARGPYLKDSNQAKKTVGLGLLKTDQAVLVKGEKRIEVP